MLEAPLHPAVEEPLEQLARDCNPESARETDLAKRRQLVWDVEKKLAEDVARAIISAGLCAALCQGLRSAAQ